MKKLTFTKDILPHMIAAMAFMVVTMIFFSPVFFEKKVISQQDIDQYKGASKSLTDYREQTGEEGLWANAMFSGMPAYLVSVEWSDGPVVILKKILSFFLPHPVNNIFVSFVCFYIMLLAFRIRPYAAIGFALAFGLSSYMIIGLAVGHNARIGAIAFMPLVMAGIHLTFTNKRILGLGVTAAGLALELRENHLQITYYLLLIVLVYGLVTAIIAFREKQLREFATSLVILIPTAALSVATFFGQFWAITEYTQYSMRGPSELVTASSKEAVTGLTKDYAFAYNYGIWEPMTLLIPNVYGGSSMQAFVQDQTSASYLALSQSQDNQAANELAGFTSHYWGPQHGGTFGAYYGGAIIVFLFVLGIVFAEKKYIWWLVPLAALSLMLSWGDAFSAFNYFLFDHLPGYNKFRSVNFALVIILFAMPLLGALGLEKFLEKGVDKKSRNKLVIAFLSTGGLCVALILFAGFGSFTRAGETGIPAWFAAALKQDRISLLRWDAFRSLAFISLVFLPLLLNVQKRIAVNGFLAVLALLIAFDIGFVDKRYVTKDNFHRKRGATYFEMSASDQEIAKDKTNYRVYNLQDPFNDAKTSYYHNSLGGYHGAKLRRYQDLIDSAILPNTRKFFSQARANQPDFESYGALNMLNAKYFVYGPEAANVFRNPAAFGNAWFVKSVTAVQSPTEELKKISEVNLRESAVIDESKFKPAAISYSEAASITLLEASPRIMKYESNADGAGLAVFSEIYYPKGWYATIDGKEVQIMRADYVLRALEIPAGKHAIEFRFDPKPYVIGNKITLASSWILLLVVVGCLGWNLKKEG